MNVTPVMEMNLGAPAGQLRATPVCLGESCSRAFVAAYCADFDVDPWCEMFFFPSDTLKLVLFTEDGREVWRRDLGSGVVPGMWFVPVLPFDLDGDGVDEIWFVNNTDPKHPLGVNKYVLERVDAATGCTTGQWPWPCKGGDQPLSHLFRNFIIGGYVHGKPVLVTAQGTYGDMFFQGWGSGMELLWSTAVGAEEPGARGSHMCPVTDLDDDGVQELMWGERCISLADGKELFCCDRDTYRGHSDVVQPLLDRCSGKWFLYTCRESDDTARPRVAMYDSSGTRLWGDLDRGHMDMGWVARLSGYEGRLIASAIRIGHKTCGPDGRFHQGCQEFAWDCLSGEPLDLGFSVYRTIPVDLDGDGYHELVRGVPGGDGAVLDGLGKVIGKTSGTVAMASKLLDRPGEQVLTYESDGTLRIWADIAADEDSPLALARYSHPFYTVNRRFTGTGSNIAVLGGI